MALADRARLSKRWISLRTLFWISNRLFWALLFEGSRRFTWSQARTASLYFLSLSSFLARAISQDQKIASAEEFFDLAKAGELLANEDDWLPPSLLTSALDKGDRLKDWSLGAGTLKQVTLLAAAESGTRFVGRFVVSKEHVRDVSVTLTPAK